MEVSELELSSMPKRPAFACLSNKTITNIFSFSLSSIFILALIHITLVFLHFVAGFDSDDIYLIVGLISLVILINFPLGLYGLIRKNYYTLFGYIFIASYHLYALLFYIIIIHQSDFDLIHQSSNNSSKSSLPESSSASGGCITLHLITIGIYIIALICSMTMAAFEIIVKAKQIEPTKIVVFDNTSSD